MTFLATDGFSFEELSKPIVHERLDDAFDFAVAQLCFRLTFELRIRQLDADDRNQTFADVVAGKILFDFLEQIVARRRSCSAFASART